MKSQITKKLLPKETEPPLTRSDILAVINEFKLLRDEISTLRADIAAGRLQKIEQAANHDKISLRELAQRTGVDEFNLCELVSRGKLTPCEWPSESDNFFFRPITAERQVAAHYGCLGVQSGAA